MAKNKILIVTGMHKSGTSVVTQWLNRCGLPVGEELSHEVAGFETLYEDPDFLHLHKAMLRGRRMSESRAATPVRQLSYEEQDILHDIISYKNTLHTQWGWKDPHTCLFLSAYRQMIPDAFYFVVLRDYRAVVSCLALRMYHDLETKRVASGGLPALWWKIRDEKYRLTHFLQKHCDAFLKTWIAYNQAILEHLQTVSDANYIVADYRFFERVDKAVYDHLTDVWGFNLDFLQFKNLQGMRSLHEPVDIDHFVRDRSLLGKADQIEKALQQYRQFMPMHSVS